MGMGTEGQGEGVFGWACRRPHFFCFCFCSVSGGVEFCFTSRLVQLGSFFFSSRPWWC
jgi:hypothetical protein